MHCRDPVDDYWLGTTEYLRLALLIQAARFFLIVLFFFAEALLLALYFRLHFLTAFDRFALLSTTGAGLVIGGATTAGAGAGAGAFAAGGAWTWNVWDAVVGLVGACPAPIPGSSVLAWSA